MFIDNYKTLDEMVRRGRTGKYMTLEEELVLLLLPIRALQTLMYERWLMEMEKRK